MRYLSLLLLSASVGFSAVLTAPEYKVYIVSGSTDVYMYGQLVQHYDFPSGLYFHLIRQGNNYLMKLKQLESNGSFRTCTLTLSPDCRVVDAGDCINIKPGTTLCPVDPKVGSFQSWFPLSGNQGFYITFTRDLDYADDNGDGQTNDVVYRAFINYAGLNGYAESIFDGNSGKLEYEVTNVYTSDGSRELYSEFHYRVEVVNLTQPKPRPQPLPAPRPQTKPHSEPKSTPPPPPITDYRVLVPGAGF